MGRPKGYKVSELTRARTAATVARNAALRADRRSEEAWQLAEELALVVGELEEDLESK